MKWYALIENDENNGSHCESFELDVKTIAEAWQEARHRFGAGLIELVSEEDSSCSSK